MQSTQTSICVTARNQPWSNDSFSFRRYTIVRKDLTNAARASGVVAMMTHEFLDFQPVPLNTEFKAVAGRSHFRFLFIICWIYVSPSTDISPESFAFLISQLHFLFVLGGDSNAHHLSCGLTISKTKIISEILEHLNFHPLNTLTSACHSLTSEMILKFKKI
ncbi:hypothetical protein GWI33_019803 [Rhynchophorus ferrugineus]|uniref:Endonuclease/exonuclease/phosphatase domain-containing protein n=1 Tax=Rhynchophorus ferrugineus TaxID=354439 RepID=A0A834HVF4_RHYFE|nr:hypothetical protein GWI33_019803 [Rhynchophorus ferrugineus]